VSSLISHRLASKKAHRPFFSLDQLDRTYCLGFFSLRYRFVDEAPRIGPGERGGTIKVGHMWVRFTERATGRTAKVRRELYELTKDRRLIR
jgi:hypothetical protein